MQQLLAPADIDCILHRLSALQDARCLVGRTTVFVTKQITTVDATGTVATAAGELYYSMRLCNGSILILGKSIFEFASGVPSSVLFLEHTFEVDFFTCSPLGHWYIAHTSSCLL